MKTDREVQAFKEMFRGRPGYTPIKGVDYFTPEEIRQFIAYIQSQIRVPKDGESIKGDKGDAGNDGKPGRAGETPERGKHYWTEKDKKAIIKDTLASIKLPTIESIIAQLPKQGKVKYEDLEGAPDLSDLPKLIDFLKRGGFRGGGGVGSGATGTQVYNEVVAGSGTAFTLNVVPTTGTVKLYALGQRLTPTTDYTIAGAVITTVSSWDAGAILADYSYT